MNREDIIKLAREASATKCGDELTGDAIERFAAIVAAAEREQCAKVCADMYLEGDMDTGLAAEAIRARGGA